MRNWHPFLADTLRTMHADGARRAIGFIAAAQHSYSSCQQYRENVAAARAALRASAAATSTSRTSAAGSITRSSSTPTRRTCARRWRGCPSRLRDAARLVCTAHSIPRADGGALAVSRAAAPSRRGSWREAAGIADWALVYQSRSGRPEDPWLEPDVCDYLRRERAAGLAGGGASCPIGFVCDHIEVLYDLDHEAAQVCREIGLPMARAEASTTIRSSST